MNKIKLPFWTYLSFVVVGFCIYFNSLNIPFYLDDINNIKNPALQLDELRLEGFTKVLTDSVLHSRPVSNLSFALNYYFGGDRVQGYHLVNLAIHISTAIILYLLLRATLFLSVNVHKYKKYPSLAYWTALVWLTHPLGTQSVVYTVQRMNSMASMFYILALYLYVKGRLNQRSKGEVANFTSIGLFFASLVSGLLGIGSKEIVATLPFAIFFYEFYFFQDLNWRWIAGKFYWFFGVIGTGGVAIWYYLGSSPWNVLTAVCSVRDFTVFERVYTQFKVVCLYISLLLFPDPSRLALDRDFPISSSLISPLNTLWAFLAIVTLLILILILAKRERLLSFCLLWFFLTLLIESSVICLEMVFEHRTYLPSMFFLFIPVAFIFRTVSNEKCCVAIFCSLILLLGVGTIERNNTWQDPIAFWQKTTELFPQKARPFRRLSSEYLVEGKYEEAVNSLKKAISLEPDNHIAYNNMGVLMTRQYKNDEAESYFKQSLSLRKKQTASYINLGKLYQRDGRFHEAEDVYSLAVKIYPDEKDFKYNLAKVLLRNQKNQQALVYLEELFSDDPDDVKVLLELGTAYVKAGRDIEAREIFENIIFKDKSISSAHYNLGLLLVREGELEKAVTHYKFAHTLSQTVPPISYNLANTLSKLKRKEEAEKYYKEYLNASSTVSSAYNNLGLLYAQAGNFQEAYDLFVKSLALSPNDKITLANKELAWEYLQNENSSRKKEE